MTTEFNTLQSVKRSFFAMRNGVIADTMRRAGSPHRIVFGLNLPQIAEIAQSRYGDCELALKLWENRTTRESRLAAPMILPPESMDFDMAVQWAEDASGAEETDILCHRLLRRLPFALQLLDALVQRRGADYLTLRLAMNLLPASAPQARALAAQAAGSDRRAEALLAARIADELDFIEGR